jgi:DNA-directed RNA polymerase subunit RPC12/RpoP
MKKCSECNGEMNELKAKTPEGIEYKYFKCSKCGEEIVNMNQLHDVAQKYRELKKYNAKISKWGMSLGLRIPSDLVKRYHLKDSEEVTIIPEKEGMKIIPA